MRFDGLLLVEWPFRIMGKNKVTTIGGQGKLLESDRYSEYGFTIKKSTVDFHLQNIRERTYCVLIKNINSHKWCISKDIFAKKKM